MKVFISYSWTPEENKNKTLELAKKLDSAGIEVILDQTHLKFGHDKYVFMEKIVADVTIDKVLIIYNKDYAEKANARTGGVGDESMIITPELYGKIEQTKFIPIVFEKDSHGIAYLPSYLKRIMYVDLSDDINYNKNFYNLLKQFREPILKRICDCFTKTNIDYNVHFNELIATFSIKKWMNDGFILTLLDNGTALFCTSIMTKIPVESANKISLKKYNKSYGTFEFEDEFDDDNITNLIYTFSYDKLNNEHFEDDILKYLKWLNRNFYSKALCIMKELFQNDSEQDL